MTARKPVISFRSLLLQDIRGQAGPSVTRQSIANGQVRPAKLRSVALEVPRKCGVQIAVSSVCHGVGRLRLCMGFQRFDSWLSSGGAASMA